MHATKLRAAVRLCVLGVRRIYFTQSRKEAKVKRHHGNATLDTGNFERELLTLSDCLGRHKRFLAEVS